MNKKLSRCLTLLLLIAGVVATVYGGGWSIITVSEFPAHAVAGDPLTLTFTVRQHGNNLLEGLKPAVQASMKGGSKVSVAALPTKSAGEYTATLRLPAPGDWTITVDGGFNAEDKTRSYNSMVLPSLKVVRDRSTAPPALSEAELGNRLFVTKGCVGCHAAGGERDLEGKQFAADYLKKVLADPSVRTQDMPNLKLRESEIVSLTAFINRGSKGKREF